MDRTKKYLITAFISVLIIVAIISILGMILLKDKPTILQGQIEATEIRISGKLPGRIDTFLVKEGQNVSAGDTLVIINSPEARAKYEQVNALENVAKYQNQKIDEGTRSQIIETMFQIWSKAKSDLQLAKTTYDRILTLYKDSVVTSQRKDEVEAIYKAAIANEKAAYQQYLMALDGAQKLTAPESGQIASIYPKRGELVGAGTTIMSLVVLDDAHVVLNVREDFLPYFKIGKTFKGNVPALNKKEIIFKTNYISPLGSYATWRSTKQTGSYDLRTFELHALPTSPVEDLRPGMSVLVNLNEQ